MKYAVEMGSDTTIHIPYFIKTGAGIQKLVMGGRDTHAQRQQGDVISLLLFFQNKERRLRSTPLPWYPVA
jgi:hypothetical protein